ncbi:MAG: hypothetical protein AM326_09875 [Candidatus Thorarchaeota archaeon SMTZ-45]|nr:MAG: hypothetical protein AM326_09875 [Candidatus Thorarchaeota archaeon SMTZ-45]KXH75537.1 MAG: hypothetical protein AM325_11025 [Candidatus Thorarchaeota archaeon SMTZ1-45]
MEEKEFVAFMKKERKSDSTIAACLNDIMEFETYLEQKGTSLVKAIPSDLESFAQDYKNKKRTSKLMWTLSHFFEFIDNKELLFTARKIRKGKIKATRKPFKIKDFRGINSEHAIKLAEIGIDNVAKMLEVGKTSEMRLKLSKQTGLNIKIIEEIVKLSDLARIQGLKGIRARLYYNAGFDFLEKLRQTSPEELLQITREFVERTGFDGIAPLPKEAKGAIEAAKKLPDIIEW